METPYSASDAPEDHARARALAVKAEAARQGLEACAIAEAAPPDPGGALAAWLAEGFHADMHWMAETAAIRTSPELRLPGAQSVVTLARLYRAPRPEPTLGPEPTVGSEPTVGPRGQVSCYAWGRDYHRALKKPVRRLARFIDAIEPGARSIGSIDSAPVLEKVWAARAGLGWIGKNSLLIRPDLGSYLFLATVMTTVRLAPDAPQPDRCGSCRACIDACPTGAILDGARVDARRCIAYHTIENRGHVPPDLAARFGDWVFGCDICQEVCPWNRKAPETADPDFHPRPGCANPLLSDLIAIDEETFRERFTGSPIMRAKAEGMRRNARIAAENTRAGRGDAQPG